MNKKKMSVLNKLITFLNDVTDEAEAIIDVAEVDTTDSGEVTLSYTLDSGDRYQFMLDYMINTLFLRQEKNAILITDDTVYTHFQLPINYTTISTEAFIKNEFGDKHPILNEFIVNKYIGYSCTSEQLKEQFDLKLEGEHNHYSFCIDNICVAIIKDVLTLSEYIVKHSALTEQEKEQELMYLFSSYLQKCSTDSLVEAFCLSINLKCNELEELEEEILINSLNKALDSLNL